MRYQACIEYNEFTQTCTQTVWVKQVTVILDPSFFPNLTVAQVSLILSAVALVFATSFGWKFINNAILNKR